MARRTFFSFHYERDIWRANVVRNSWVTREREASGFFDASLWEEAKRKGDAAIRRMIDAGLANTSVTCVLIGAETADRDYVAYEIEQSYNAGKGLLGVRIHSVKDRFSQTDFAGSNPFQGFTVTDAYGRRTSLASVVPIHDWVRDNGYSNLGSWIESAALQAGR